MNNLIISKVVLVAFTLTLINCHQKPGGADTITSEQSRIPASAVDVQSRNLTGGSALKTEITLEQMKAELKTYPTSFLEFLKGKSQRAQLQPTLKQYSKILPQDIYQRLLTLSKKVDDSGFSIERKNSELILKSAKGQFTANIKGPIEDLQMVFEDKAYDLNQSQVLSELLTDIENRVAKDSATKNSQYNLNSNSLFNMCLINISFMTQAADANFGGWFALGGLALIAIAIIIAANKLGKSVKNTKHEVNVNHTVGVGKGTTDAINNLAGSVNNLDPAVLSNNTINLTPPVIETTTLDDLGIAE